MPCYISSNNERLYAAIEGGFGQAAAVTAQHRFPAVKFGARQQAEKTARRDKTGSRTYPGLPSGMRRRTGFDLKTYLTSWGDRTAPPAYGALFQGALGGSPELFPGTTTATGTTATTIKTVGPHGLSFGQAVTFGGELRFVVAVPNATTFIVNQEFTVIPSAGSSLGATVSYRPATELPSLSIFDYWNPSTAMQRFLNGAVVDRMSLTVNGDFHEFEFSGAAKDLIDNSTFQGGVAGLTSYPNEPALADFDYSIVPGHLGQAWLGAIPSRFYTITSAQLNIENGVDLRDREFGGGPGALCSVAGERKVSLKFSLYERDDAGTTALYQAARQQSPISVMFQLGQQPGQLFGVMMTGVIPEVPEFDDSETRLLWRFNESRAQGTADDEIFVAFG